MWEATNYKAQVEQMEKAGLSVAGMYSSGRGGGGATASQGSGASGAVAPAGGGEIGMALQMQLLQAQKQNIEANTNKTNVEAAKIGGIDTEEVENRIKNLQEGIENTKAATALTRTQERLTHIATQIQGDTIEDARDQVRYQANKLIAEVEQISRANEMNEATKKDLIKTVKAQMLGAFLQNALTKAQTNNTTADTKLKGTQGEALVRNWVQQAMNWETGAVNANTNQKAQSHEEWINDVSQSLALPVSVVREMVDGIFRK